MKTIVAGGREITDYGIVTRAINRCGWEITEVVCGGATGADAFGKLWAKQCGIPVTMMPADWKKHGKAAGPIRNRAMADYANALVACWDGASRGTRNMIEEARARGLRVYVHRYVRVKTNQL